MRSLSPVDSSTWSLEHFLIVRAYFVARKVRAELRNEILSRKGSTSLPRVCSLSKEYDWYQPHAYSSRVQDLSVLTDHKLRKEYLVTPPKSHDGNRI